MRGLLKCILAEFMKVKRKKFVLGTLLAAWILPVPLTIIVVKAKLSFDILFMFAIEFGFFLILPIVLGIIASSSINVEYDNQTFKNMLSISISKGMMLWAKIIFLIFMSFLYGIGAMVSVTIGGVVLGDYASVMSKLGMAVLLSFMVALSIRRCFFISTQQKFFFCGFQNAWINTCIWLRHNLNLLSPLPNTESTTFDSGAFSIVP